MMSVDPASFATRVPSCPDWDVTALFDHTSAVHRYWTYSLKLPPGEPTDHYRRQRRPEDVSAVDWFREGVAALVRALKDTVHEARCLGVG